LATEPRPKCLVWSSPGAVYRSYQLEAWENRAKKTQAHAATTKVKLCSVWRSLCRDDNVFNDVAFLRPYKFKSRHLMTGHLPSSSSSITLSLFHSKLNLPFLQTLPTVAFLFFFRTDSADSPDCLPILLTISVFLFSFCFYFFYI